jgi:hypothetical protein
VRGSDAYAEMSKSRQMMKSSMPQRKENLRTALGSKLESKIDETTSSGEDEGNVHPTTDDARTTLGREERHADHR